MGEAQLHILTLLDQCILNSEFRGDKRDLYPLFGPVEEGGVGVLRGKLSSEDLERHTL